jgi:hypothetical protein
MGDWRNNSSILDLGSSWSEVSFKPRLLYLRGKRPQYPLHRWLDGPQSRSGNCEVQKNLLPLSGIEPRPSSP